MTSLPVSGGIVVREGRQSDYFKCADEGLKRLRYVVYEEKRTIH